MQKKMIHLISASTLLMSLFVTTCSLMEGEEIEAKITPSVKVQPEATNLPEAEAVLSPEKEREISIFTSDGGKLEGSFYPAVKAHAPLVILMHWMRGDKSAWTEVAYWLQNYSVTEVEQNQDDANKEESWLDPTWFPPLAEDESYNVLTFTFDGCLKNGCSTMEREKWLRDAQAAYETARSLEGVDSTRIIGIGASIGADAAVDGCLYINSLYPRTCQGVISLSPGSYLNLDFKDVVAQLNSLEPPVSVQCFYATGDSDSAEVCSTIKDRENYTSVVYHGAEHGMQLIQPGLEHDTLSLILQFLRKTVGTK